MGKLDGKIALVAGNLGKLKKDKFKSGLGAAIAKDFINEGAQVIVIDLDKEVSEACAKALASDKVKAKHVDLLKDRAYEEKKYVNERGQEKVDIVWTDNPALDLVNEIVNEFGKLDILVTNFDHFEKGRLENMTDEEYRIMYNEDIKTVFHLLAAVRDQFASQKKKTGEFAKIVMLTNMVGKGGLGAAATYSGIKAAIVHGVKTAAREFGRFANINAVAMAPLSTKKMQGPPDRVKKSFFLTSCDMAKMDITEKHIVPIVRLLSSDEGEGFCGQCISVDGGLWLHAEL